MTGPAARLRALAADLRWFASRSGPPETVETLAYWLPGSTTAHAVYDLAIALSVADLDAATAVDRLADRPADGAGES